MIRAAVSSMALLLAFWAGGCVPPTPLVVISDPEADDHGPGAYRYPVHPAFSAGLFDLRQVALSRAGDEWEIEVEFGAQVRRTRVFLSRDERREIFLQTVDVYFALTREGGHQESLPGRGVQFAPGNGWHRAVVISPVPDVLRRVLDKTVGLGGDVLVPLRVVASGKRLSVRVPVGFLGEEIPVGITALVTGTRFTPSFRIADRIRGELLPEGLASDVIATAGECRLDDPADGGCSFSGCGPCGAHPKTVDVLLPAGEQERILGDYDAEMGRLAVLPLLPILPALQQ